MMETNDNVLVSHARIKMLLEFDHFCICAWCLLALIMTKMNGVMPKLDLAKGKSSILFQCIESQLNIESLLLEFDRAKVESLLLSHNARTNVIIHPILMSKQRCLHEAGFVPF